MPGLKPPVNNSDHVQGNKQAIIELVEYGDYECPHCGHAYPIIKKAQKRLGDKMTFIFRNFPLSQIHPNAMNAAVAAEAASAQQKFWEMHDIIFENQHHLNDTDLVNYAAKIGLDVEQFKIDFEKPVYFKKAETDFESGIRSGVNGTPSFFINGAKYDGSWEEKDLTEYLLALVK